MTSRERFEAWFLSEHEEVENSNELSAKVMKMMAWQSWKAAEISSEQNLTDMAVQLANVESKCRELAAENAELKSAFDKPQAYLSWHAIPPTWEDPLPCGEYLDVHDEAGHKNSDGTDCWPVFAKPEIKTTSTDAFLAEVRASGVEMYADNLDSSADDAERDGFDDAVKFLRSESSGVRLFAAQLRKGATQ